MIGAPSHRPSRPAAPTRRRLRARTAVRDLSVDGRIVALATLAVVVLRLLP